MAVTLTEAAARHVARYIGRRGKGVGVRLGVKTTGCSGLAYKLEYADDASAPHLLDELDATRHSSASYSSSSSPAIPGPHAFPSTSPSPGPVTPPPSSTAASTPASAPTKQFAFIALQGNTVRKRPRRRYDEIERLYACSWHGCSKSYGTLNHLNAHVTMQKHGPKRSPAGAPSIFVMSLTAS